MLFRYDLNQIPYNHMVEMTNRFKGLALKTECLKTYGQRSLQKYWRDQGNISCKDGHDKDKNGKDLTEAEEIKRWQEHTEQLYKTGLLTQITTVVWTLTWSQISWTMKSCKP